MSEGLTLPFPCALKSMALGMLSMFDTVLKIVNGPPTDIRLSAEEAFNDSRQAVEQILYAERYGSAKELRLARLAYRQYQGKRFRMK